MNKLLIALVGSWTLIATLPAVAGPDWQLIEQARKAKQSAPSEKTGGTVATSGTGAQRMCPAEPLVLGLDHGPRATSTPQLNQQRRERYEALMKACQGQAK